MYLHLGQAVMIPDGEVLAVFDLDNARWAYKTREFLERAEQEGRAVWLTDDLPRSFVLTQRAGGEPMVYISPLSAGILKKRLENDSVE